MIFIYKTQHCPYCQQVARYLDTKGKKYEFIDITDDHARRLELQRITGATTVPITFKGKKFVVGYNIGKLKELIG